MSVCDRCDRCRRSRPSFDDHASCPQCKIAAGVCNVDMSNPCSVCVGWTSKTWGKLRRSLVDARSRAISRGRQHWMSAFPYLEAWISRPASTAASSEPGSEISSFIDSGDDMSEKTVASMTVTAVPVLGMALPLTPSTIQSIVVPLSVQDTPSVEVS